MADCIAFSKVRVSGDTPSAAEQWCTVSGYGGGGAQHADRRAPVQADGSGQQLVTPPLDGTILPSVQQVDCRVRLIRPTAAGSSW